jgi:hypothetical protein
MKLNAADGARLNTILGKKVFGNHTVGSDEVKAKTGLTIRELTLCWLFDPRNDFQKALHEWRENGEPMNFEKIQRY